MSWIRGAHSPGIAPAVARASHPRKEVLKAFGLVVLCSLLLSGAPTDKYLSVYSVAANYSLPIVQREGRDYIGLLELLEPLGRVNAKAEGVRWRLRFNNVEGMFFLGKTHARVQDRDADLIGKFLMENKRGLVPVAALSSLLPRLLGGPVTLHEQSERLFIGSVGTHFTAALSGDNPPRLVLRFTAPVNPTIANEPGTLRMTFSREPVVAPASPTLTFGNKAIPSAIFSESKGAAVLTVTSSVPVMATFGADGKTITIAPTGTAAQTASGNAPAPSTSIGTTTPPATTTSAPPSTTQRRYFAVIDASHGGDDRGEALSSSLVEKDVTVALARSLRQELESRGITALVLRDSDANLSLDQRAIFANADHAAIYIALHAASSGRGVHVYTALLPVGDEDRGPFRSWTTAQHPALPLSQSTATAIAAELQKRQVPVRTLAAPLRPLNNIAGPALAIELAPQGSDVTQLTAPDYQQLVTSAVATAIASTHDALGGAP